MRRRGLKALVLTAALLLQLSLPALAAGPRLTYRDSGSRGARLILRDLGEGNVYGVQLELTVAGSYASASFTPDSGEAYSPDCGLETARGNTQITVYVTSRSPLNDGERLDLGILELDKSFSMPSTATVTLLGRELKPLSGGDGVTLPVSEAPRETGGGGGGGNSIPTNAQYAINVEETVHGTVTADAKKARFRDKITLTVRPDRRYELESLTATDGQGRELTLTEGEEGEYTFLMPYSDVTVTARFRRPPQEPIDLPFTDVGEEDWFREAVEYVYRRKMMTGTSETAFDPGLTTSRGMIVTVLHRLAGAPPAELSGFPDVPVTQYYAGPVGWASANGIVSGYGGNETGTFGPENSITREQLATILYRYAEKEGYDTDERGDLSAFTDREEISSYAADTLSWAVGVGLISGMGNGRLDPGGSATRAQVATMLMRFCENVAEME